MSHFNRKYTINENFFDNWSRPMSYILGFLLADGCVLNDRLQFAINSDDVTILEYIRSNIGDSLPIYFRKIKNTGGKFSNIARLCIYSKKIVNVINFKYKIHKRKTGNERLPKDIPNWCLGDFLRGVFDVDGTIYCGNTNPFRPAICSASLEFLKEIQKIIGGGKISKVSTIWDIRFYGNDAFVFRDLIYSNEEFALERKKKIMFSVNRSDLKHLRFSKYEEDMLLKNFDQFGLSCLHNISSLLNRSYHSVRQKLGRLRLLNKED